MFLPTVKSKIIIYWLCVFGSASALFVCLFVFLISDSESSGWTSYPSAVCSIINGADFQRPGHDNVKWRNQVKGGC